MLNTDSLYGYRDSADEWDKRCARCFQGSTWCGTWQEFREGHDRIRRAQVSTICSSPAVQAESGCKIRVQGMRRQQEMERQDVDEAVVKER